MSQEGILSLVENMPTVPTSFVANSGSATPVLNTLNLFAAAVAAGTNPARTVASGNTLTVDVQTSQAIAASDATKIGLAAFNSAQFTVDANGFVTLSGGSSGTTITGQSGGALSPVLGNWNIFGGTALAGSTPVTTSGSGNTLTTKVQLSQATAGTDATKVGLAAFNSAQFSVDANGFVTTSGTGVLQTLTGNSGGSIAPVAGTINTIGTGSITIAGAGNTLTTQLTGLTNHNILLGAGTATVGLVAPTANTGAILQNNAAADPTYSTATYPSTTTVSQILYSSATNVVSGLATANRAVLTTGTTGIPVVTALATDGQLIIGSTAGAPAAALLTPGTGISITNASNSITISTTGTTTLTVTPLTHAATPYTVLSTDDFLAITDLVGTFTVKLPNAPSTGKVSIIKDSNGSAASFNIAVTTVGGAVTIDGQTTYTMATNYQSISVIFDGSNYEVF